MTENLLLAIIGTLMGFLVGQYSAELLLYVTDAPSGIRVITDWRILCIGILFTFLSALVFGLTPAIQTVRRGTRITRSRQILVAVQVAASCILLIVGSDITKQVLRAMQIDLKFDHKRMVVVEPQFYSQGLKPPVVRQKLDALLDRLRQLPGVDGVAVATAPPFGGGAHISKAPSGTQLWLNDVTPSYFAMMRLPILRGRGFGENEKDAAIVSESAARVIWPNEDPLGEVCTFCDVSKRSLTVVGVVGETGYPPAGYFEIYTPIDDQNVDSASLIVHTIENPLALQSAARVLVATPGTSASAWMMQTQVDRRGNGVRRAMTVVGSLGSVATTLAAIGIFGLVSFAVSQRTREIGVRMALGARATDILQAVLSQYAIPVGVGVVSGIGLAMAVTRVLRNQSHEFGELDPVSYLAGVALFAIIACAAAIIPASRALRIDPSAALRSE